jgi:hypothetical protein
MICSLTLIVPLSRASGLCAKQWRPLAAKILHFLCIGICYEKSHNRVEPTKHHKAIHTHTLRKFGMMPPATYKSEFFAFMSLLDGTTYSPCQTADVAEW